VNRADEGGAGHGAAPAQRLSFLGVMATEHLSVSELESRVRGAMIVRVHARLLSIDRSR
jgi:hypothetical protein